MGKRRNKKKPVNDGFAPAQLQAPSSAVNPMGQPIQNVASGSQVQTTDTSQYWSDNVGASADVNQPLPQNMGPSHFGVASADDIAVPPEHVNPMGMPPPGFNPQMQPVFMPSYGYPVMQDFGGYPAVSGAVYSDVPFQSCPFMGMGSQAMGSQAIGSQAMGSQAIGSQAMGSQAIGSQAMGSQAIGSQAMGSQDFQASDDSLDGTPFGSPLGGGFGEEFGASSVSEPIQSGNVAGAAVNEAMLEDPAIIVAQSPPSSLPKLNGEINKIKELTSQAIGECKMLKEDVPNPNDCWADQVEKETVELELLLEAKKLDERSKAEKAETAYVEKSNSNNNGKPPSASVKPTKGKCVVPTESKEVVKEMQAEAPKIQEKSSAEKTEAAFVQSLPSKSKGGAAIKKPDIDVSVAQELAKETNKLQEKTTAEQAEVAFMEAQNSKPAEESKADQLDSAVMQDMQSEGKKAQEKAIAEKAEAEFMAKVCEKADTGNKKASKETDKAVVEDMQELGQKAEALKAANTAQTEHVTRSQSKKEDLKSGKDDGEKYIAEALKAEGERSQIFMNAAHCEAVYFEKQSQVEQEPEKKEKKVEKQSNPTENKGPSWASIVAEPGDRTALDVEKSPKDKEPPKQIVAKKTSSRISPEKAEQKKEKSPPKKQEAITPTDDTPAAESPFVDEEGFVEPRQSRRNRRRKISRRSESDQQDEDEIAQTPDEAAPASSTSERPSTRDENGNQVSGHRMNITDTDEVSTQTDKKKIATIQSQTETPANAGQDKTTKKQDAIESELMQEKSQRMAGEGIIKVLEAEMEQLRKQMVDLQTQHVTVENDYIMVKGDLAEEKRLAVEYKSRCGDLEKEVGSKRNEVVTLQTKLQQKESWIGGTDYMLELKEANKKAQESDATVSAMENQLKQAQNEVKKLQDQVHVAQAKQIEMIPRDQHIALLQKAEDKAMESEMKILQVQTELLALQNNQTQGNAQVEKQIQPWASVAVKPSPPTKAPEATPAEKDVLPALVPETSGEENGVSSKNEGEGEGEGEGEAAAPAPVGDTKPQEAAGSKKEVKNAANKGNKGRGRSESEVSEEAEVEGKLFQMASIPPIDYSGLSGHKSTTGVFSGVSASPRTKRDLNSRKRKWQGGDGYGLTDEEDVVTREIDPQLINGVCEEQTEEEEDELEEGHETSETFQQRLDKLCKQLISDLDAQDEFKDAQDDQEDDLEDDLDDDPEDDLEDERTAFVDAEYDNGSTEDQKQETEKESETEWEDAGDMDRPQNIGQRSNRDSGYLEDDIETFEYCLEDIEDGLRGSSEEKELCDVCDNVQEDKFGSMKVTKDEASESDQGSDEKYDDNDDDLEESEEECETEEEFLDPEATEMMAHKGLVKKNSTEKTDEKTEKKTGAESIQSQTPPQKVEQKPVADSDSDDDFWPENIFEDEQSDEEIQEIEQKEKVIQQEVITMQRAPTTKATPDVQKTASVSVSVNAQKDSEDEKSEDEDEEEEEEEEAEEDEEEVVKDTCTEVKVFPRGAFIKKSKDEVDDELETDTEEYEDEMQPDEYNQSSVYRDYAFFFISIITAVVALVIAIMLSTPDAPIHLEISNPDLDYLDLEDQHDMNLNNS